MVKAIPILLLGASLLALDPAAGMAHHGWSWTTGKKIELTGAIKTARLGNPHGVLTVDADGEVWTVEVGQPWRNERAGLKSADFAVGKVMRFVGEPSADVAQKLMKAEQIFIGTREYALYPERI